MSGCVDDEVLAKLLVNSASGEDWLNQDADLALQKKLQRSYSVYLDTVKSMSRSLDEFRQRLHLDADGKVRRTYPASEGARLSPTLSYLCSLTAWRAVDR